MNNVNQVFIVDDDAAIRDTLSMLLEGAGYTAVAFPCAENFLNICTADTSGCIILEVSLPGISGPELQEELIRRGYKLPIIFLSGHGNIPIAVRAIKSGAIDFLTKPADETILRSRVQEALERCSRLKKQKSINSRLSMLSEREREIMMLIVKGHSSKEIAQMLSISHRTTETHRAHIMQKTGASNTLELARILPRRANR